MIAFKIRKLCQVVDYLVKDGCWQGRLKEGGRSALSSWYTGKENFKVKCLLTNCFKTKTEEVLKTHPHCSKKKAGGFFLIVFVCLFHFSFALRMADRKSEGFFPTSEATAAKSLPQIFEYSQPSVLSFNVPKSSWRERRCVLFCKNWLWLLEGGRLIQRGKAIL